MINETKYMRQQITNLIQIIDTIKYNTLMTDWNIQTHIYKFNQIVTNELNKFKGFETSYIINVPSDKSTMVTKFNILIFIIQNYLTHYLQLNLPINLFFIKCHLNKLFIKIHFIT